MKVRFLLLLIIWFHSAGGIGFCQDKSEEDILKEEREATYRRHHIRTQANPVTCVNLLLRNVDAATESLDLTSDQVDELNTLSNELSMRLQDEKFGDLFDEGTRDVSKVLVTEEFLNLSVEKQEALRTLLNEMNDKICDVLMIPQLERIRDINLAFGLPANLLNSPVGEIIGLSDRQRKTLNDKSLSFADEIDQIARRIRDKAKAVVKEQLTQRQWVQLEEIYGKRMDTYQLRRVGDFPVLYKRIDHAVIEQEKKERQVQSISEERRLAERMCFEPSMIICFILKTKNFSGQVGFTEGQIEKLEVIKEKYSVRLTDAVGDIPGCREADFSALYNSEQYVELDGEKQQQLNLMMRELDQEIRLVLTTPQLHLIANANFRNGLPVILLNSPVGDFLELSDRQKEMLYEESLKFVKEVDEITQKVRSKARRIVEETVTARQWNEIVEIYGKKEIDEYPRADMDRIMWSHQRVDPNHRVEDEFVK